MFFEGNYIIKGFFTIEISGGQPTTKNKWVLQSSGYVQSPDDIILWQESLPDAFWDDSKIWYD